MNVRLDRSLERELNQLASAFRAWGREAERDLTQAHRTIGNRWKGEAKKRVPVDEGTLKQRILANTYHDRTADEIVTEVGTNVPYGKYLEFGTKHIAGGRVKALGEDEGLTDRQAIHDWPAKSGEAGDKTSASIDAKGGASGRLRNAGGQFLRGSPQEQMPWLRPAFNSIREWAVDLLTKAFRPPKQ